jgi:hypothetical protein
MKPADIKRLAKKIRIKSNAVNRERILTDAEAALLKSTKNGSKVPRPAISIWRIIMKSKITKLAAAAVIIIAVIAIVKHLGGSIEPAGVAFAQATEALKKVRWVHTTGTDGYEGWINHESQVSITKAADGRIEFSDYKKSKKYEYDPESNTLTISRTSGDFHELPLQWQEYLKLFAQRQPDIEVSRRKDRVGGNDVEIYILNWAKVGFLRKSEVTVAVQSDLPLSARLKITRSNGTLVTDAKTVFEYPQDGPTTIYDLGVPRSAKVFDYSGELLINEREESALMLRTLGVALVIYANEHNNKYPETLQEVQPYTDNLEWFTQNVEYLGKGKSPRGSARDVIAYDKTLLEKGNSTNILFCDTHLRFGAPKRFIKQEAGD